MIISVDPGKANLNAYDGLKEFTCPSTMAIDVDKVSTGYAVEVEGVKYLIGDETLPYDYDMTKEKTLHKLLMYLALYKLVPDNESCTVIVGCPMDIFLNKNLKKSYREYLMTVRYPTITVGGVPKRIFIDNIIIAPESCGIVFRKKELFTNKMLGVIDIGGSTINYSVYQNRNINRDMSFTEARGMHYLREEIRGAIQREFGYTVTEKEIPYLMKDADQSLMRSVIDKSIVAYFSKIKKDMMSKHWSPNLNLIFTGGGTIELEDMILQTFQNATISDTPLCDNCVGYYQMGVILCDYKKI